MLSLTLLLACNPPPPPAVVPGTIDHPGDPAMTVNGRPIGTNELDFLWVRSAIAPAHDPKSAKHVAEEYAVANVLYDMAVKDELWKDPQIQLQAATVVRQVLASAERDKLAKAGVTDEAVQKWYEQKKAMFDKPEVHARMILVPSESQAKDLLDRIHKGEDFAAIATAHSMHDSKAQGGDLGWLHENEGPEPTVADPMWKAAKGDLFGPIEGRMGFYLVQVLDKRDATPMDEVRKIAEPDLMHSEGVKQIDQIRTSMKVEWIKPLPDAPPDPPSVRVGMPEGHP